MIFLWLKSIVETAATFWFFDPNAYYSCDDLPLVEKVGTSDQGVRCHQDHNVSLKATSNSEGNTLL